MCCIARRNGVNAWGKDAGEKEGGGKGVGKREGGRRRVTGDGMKQPAIPPATAFWDWRGRRA